MTIKKLSTVAFTSATAAIALLAIASATAKAQDDFSHAGASTYWKSQETSTPLPAGFLRLAGHIEGFADYIPYLNGMGDPSGLTSPSHVGHAETGSIGVESSAEYLPYVNGIGDPSGLASPRYDAVAEIEESKADGVMPAADGHTRREAWGEAPIVDNGALPNAAYFVVNLHYCMSSATIHADRRLGPTGAAAIVYEEVLMGTYGGNCDDFYAEEVRPRLYLSDDQS